MRTRLTGRLSLLFLTFALILAMPAVALADVVTVSDTNTLQASGDTTKQAGQTGSARFHLLSTGNDDPNDLINNCNADASNKVKVTATSEAVDKNGNALATSPVTFNSPGYVELAACDTPGTSAIEGAQSLGYAVGSSAQVGDVITVKALASGGKTQKGGTVTGHFSYDTFKITVVAPPEQGTALSVSPASGTYGGTTSLSATLSSSSTGVSGKSVDFTLNGQSVGSATTNSSGVATLTGVSLSGLDAGTHADAVSASYAGTGSGCTTSCYGASDGTAALTVNAKQLTGSFTADNKEYNGNTSATVTADALPGVLAGDAVSLDVTNAQFDTKNVGTGKTVSANLALSGADASNYSLSSATGTDTANITAKSVTGSFTADNKVYDGTNSATASNRTLNGAVNGDTVSLSGGTATFADENVGPNKAVTLTGATLGGADAGNYSLASVGTTTAAITVKELTGSFTAENKVYDGTTDATIATSNLVGVVQGDDVGLSGDEASFANKNVANGKTVTVNSGALSGTDASNYSLKAGPWTATADITPKSITGSFTADNKVYDGTTAATISGRSLQGAIGGDAVSLSGGNATFANKDVGTAKTVTGTGFGLSGTDAANYTLGSVSNTTASITAKSLTGSFTAADKVYDGNDSATVTGRSLPGAVAGDAVSLDGGTAKFSNKNVGTDKPVTLTGASLVGADKGNYTLGSVSNAEADITARDLTVSATGIDKVYDGNARATVELSTNELSGDTVTAYYTSASFDNANAGTGKVVTVSGISVAGADSGNYTFNTSTTASANIAQRAITVTAEAKSKTYGDPDPALDFKVGPSGLAPGDTLGGVFSGNLTRDPGENVGSYAIRQGTLAANSNYDLRSYNEADFTITARATTVTADSHTKQIGAADPALTYRATNLAPGDTLGGVFSGSLIRDPGEGIGTYAIKKGTLAANSNYSLSAFTPGTLKIVYGTAFGGIQQPINADGSSRVKLGSTVPVKFTLSSNGSPLNSAVAYLNVKKLDNSPDMGVDEAPLTIAPSSGNQFRLGDATTGQYIYNLSTKNAFTGANGSSITTWTQGTYQLQIVLDDGTARTVNIQIVK
jgi:hypothetical protein